MNSLPQLRRSLVEAAERQAASVSQPRRRRRTSRHAGLRVLAAVGVAGVLVAAGKSIFGPTGNPKYIPQFDCGTAANAGIHALTSTEPVSACAALWPSLYHHPAPALAAWIPQTGGAVVVRPVHSPPSGGGWIRLPKGWRDSDSTIELTDQIEDVTTGLPSRYCWTAASASTLVKSILRSDALGYWQVKTSHEAPLVASSASCLSVAQVLGGIETKPGTVLLVEHATTPPPNGVARYPSSFSGRIRLVERRVNRTLRYEGHCASVATAEAVWRTDAHAGGIPAARYALNAAASTAGGCARVFVSEPGGGGPANVIAADYP